MRILGRLGISAAWLLLAILSAPLADAQETTRTLRVATRIVPPLVVRDGVGLSGFSIDLWNDIAGKLGARTEFVVAPDMPALLSDVAAHKADLGIAAISITAERAETFDFSQPMLSSGLQILVRGSGEASANPLTEILRLLVSPAIVVWFGIALLLIIVPAHILWLVERHHEHGITDRRYFPGIFHALWWAGSTLATQAEQMPRHWIGRVLAVLWMFVGIIFVAYYTAQLTASMTVEQIRGAISGPDDLPGKRVATTRGSTAAAYLKQHKAVVEEMDEIGSAYTRLLDRDVDAVVFDAPVLQYYAEHEGKGRVQLVGPVFRKENFGIVFPADSILRKEVDRALLDLRENGTYQRLQREWFGAD